MSRRTSTTRAYKSGGAGRAAGGKPALERRGQPGKDPPTVGDGPMHGHHGKARRGPAGGGLEGRSGVRMGTEWEGRRLLAARWSRGRRLTQPYAAPAGTQMKTQDTLEKHREENRAPRPHFPKLSGSCAILPRKWGEGAGVPGDAPPQFSPCPQRGDSA